MIVVDRGYLSLALRSLARRPGFTIGAVLILTLGIGANAAVFSVINVVMLEPLPYEDPDELVMLWTTDRATGNRSGFVSFPDLLDWRELNTTFEDLSAFWTFPNGDVNLTGGSQPERVPVARALAGHFELLGGVPLLGRTFLPEENVVGNHRRAILTHGLWERRFGGDTSLIGEPVFVNGFPYTVVGVMPSDFRPLGTVALGNEIQLWRPLAPDDNQTGGRQSRVLRAVGRLRDGIKMADAQADMDRIAARLADAYPDTNRDIGVRVVALRDQVAGDVRPALLVLMAAAGFVLVVACANVAGLLLVRAAAARKQLAIHAALGASRSVIVTRVMIESILLGLAGAVGGCAVAMAGVRVLAAIGPAQIPLLSDVAVDQRVLAFGVMAGILASLLVGVVPALRVSDLNLARDLRDTGRTGGRRSERRHADALVVAEIGLALVLLVAGGLLVRSFQRLADVDPGLEPGAVLTFQLELPMATDYPDQSGREVLFRDLLDRLRAVGGVEAVSMASGPPVEDRASSTTFRALDAEGETTHDANFRMVAPDYFEVLSIPVRRGRAFRWSDNDGPRGVVVSQSVARSVWGDRNPLGMRIRTPFGPEAEVLGVVGDVSAEGLDGRVVPTVYLMSDQWTYNFMTVLLRTRGNPMTFAQPVTQIVREIDPQLPVYNVRTMQDMLSASVDEQRFQTLLLSTFSGLTLLLAVVGTYTVVSSNVAERTLEFSIRSAIGAPPRDTVRLVLVRGIKLAALGICVGLLGSLIANRALQPLLFEIGPWDAMTLVAAPLALVGAAIAAMLVPAWRAVRVDPMITMRAE